MKVVALLLPQLRQKVLPEHSALLIAHMNQLAWWL